MNVKHTIAATAAVVAAAGGVPAVAAAEERVCRGTIGAATLDNVRVPQYATCTLNGTYVKGTVKVERSARLVADTVRVVGNVQAENAAHVTVRDASRVGGSVQVKQGGGATVTDSRVTHDVQYDANRQFLRALRNVVGGSIQVMGNTGGVEIRGNRVNGNLQCKSNRPAPVGGGNIVQGNKEDQCARL
jgi:hypothetical protein